MNSKRPFDGQDLTDKGLRIVLFIVDGFCIITVVLVPIFALTVGGYLATIGQYLLATVITITGGGLAYWLYRRHKTHPQ